LAYFKYSQVLHEKLRAKVRFKSDNDIPIGIDLTRKNMVRKNGIDNC
jgi:hypothetical protein